MKPYSKVIQMLKVDDGSYYYVVLCEDGSMWKYYFTKNKFELLTELENHSYTVDKAS